MLAKRIIACLDVKDGKVVKGKNFVGLAYAGEPAQLAAKYAREGADEIVFLDISASREGRKAQAEWIAETASSLDVPFTVGGGISSIKDVSRVLGLGADKVCINTAALENPRLVSQASRKFGAQCIVVAVDSRQTARGADVFSYGGTVATGKTAVGWASRCEKFGAGEILLTSIDRDGTRQGFDCKLTRKVVDAVRIPVIASGGAGSCKDFLDVFVQGKADAALAAGVFHYGALGIPDLKSCLKKQGVEVRC